MRTIYAVRLIHWTEQRSDYRSFGVYESNIMMPPGLLKVGMYSIVNDKTLFVLSFTIIMPREQILLKKLREGSTVGLKDRITLVFLLAYPAVIAMMTTVVTEYIDAAMVGHTGSEKLNDKSLMLPQKDLPV